MLAIAFPIAAALLSLLQGKEALLARLKPPPVPFQARIVLLEDDALPLSDRKAQSARSLNQRARRRLAWDASDPVALLELARANQLIRGRAEALPDFHRALHAFESAIEQRSDDARLHLHLGRLYKHLGSSYGDASALRRGLEELGRAWRMDPALTEAALQSSWSWFFLGIAQGDGASIVKSMKAARSWAEVAMEEPATALPGLVLACMSSALGDRSAMEPGNLARWSLDKAEELMPLADDLAEPRRARAVVFALLLPHNLVSWLVHRGLSGDRYPIDERLSVDFLRAQSELEQGIEMLSDYPELRGYAELSLWALEYALEGEEGDAERFERGAAAVREEESWIEVRAALLFTASRFEQADRLCELLTEKRDDERSHYLRANLAHRAGKLDLACASYRRALERAPSHDPSRLGLAVAVLQSGAEPAQAMELLSSIEVHSPEKGLAEFASAIARAIEDRTLDARGHLEQALALLPDDPDVRAAADELFRP